MKRAMLTVLGAFFVLAAVLAQAQEFFERPIWKVGDSWTYKITGGADNDTIQVESVTEVLPDGYTVKVTSGGNTVSTRKYNLDMNLTDWGEIHITPERDVFHFPLRVGQLYMGKEFKYPHPRKPGVLITAHSEMQSLTLKTRTVKAGTFNAVEHKVKLPYRQSGLGTYANYIEATYLYIPSIGCIAEIQHMDWGGPKDIRSWERELIAFHRQPS